MRTTREGTMIGVRGAEETGAEGAARTTGAKDAAGSARAGLEDAGTAADGGTIAADHGGKGPGRKNSKGNGRTGRKASPAIRESPEISDGTTGRAARTNAGAHRTIRRWNRRM
jgi:hypothetical protein